MFRCRASSLCGKKSKQPAARAFSLATPATPGGLADVGPVMISFGHVHDISMQASQPAALDRRASQNPGTGSSLTQVGVCNGPQFFPVARGFRHELSMLRHSTMDIRIGPSPGLWTPLSVVDFFLFVTPDPRHVRCASRQGSASFPPHEKLGSQEEGGKVRENARLATTRTKHMGHIISEETKTVRRQSLGFRSF